MSTHKSVSIALAGFLVGSVVTASLSRLLPSSDGNTKQDNKPKNDTTCVETTRANSQTLPQEIRDEQLSRNQLYFGDDGLNSIKKSSVLIVGLGGVGSHTAHMLARAGVSYLRFVDFDQVTLSSLNRHACATLEDVGLPKVVALKKFLEKICPDKSMLNIDARAQMYTGNLEKDGDMMDCPNGSWDMVIDAIDDVPTKAKLLTHCVRNQIRVISCMGAGGKSDMTRLHISNLRSACKDPLATKLRQSLRRNLKGESSVKDESCLDDMDQIAVVYSSEKTVVKLADFTDQQKEEGVHKYGAVDNMRIRIIPVLGTMPAIMGQSLAAMAICELGNKPFSPLSGERVARNVRHKLFQHLKNREMKIRDTIEEQNGIVVDKSGDRQHNEVVRPPAIINGCWVGPPQVDVDDVEYVFAEVWRNRCCVSNMTLGTVLHVIRWDISKECNCQNLVIVGSKAKEKYDEAASATGDGRNSVSEERRQQIEARLATCKIDSRA